MEEVERENVGNEGEGRRRLDGGGGVGKGGSVFG
jgi:hypothetical protein